MNIFLKDSLIEHLELISKLMELSGENSFKSSAITKVASAISNLDENKLSELIETKKLCEIPGIGKGTSNIISEFYLTKSSSVFSELSKKFPQTIFELFNVRGLGIKRIKLLVENYNVASLDDLKNLCTNDSLSKIKNFGALLQKQILEQVDFLKNSQHYIHLHFAIKRAESIINKLKTCPEILKIEKTGELRRIREVISSLDFVILSNDIEKVAEFIETNYSVISTSTVEIANSTIRKITVKDTKISIIFYIVNNQDKFHKLLIYTTPEAALLAEIKTQFNVDILEQMEPEQIEFEYFESPKNLRNKSNLSISEIKGIFHFHTTYSDGINSLEEMFSAVQNYGFKIAAVCDHSVSSTWAGGLSVEKILEQKLEIQKLSNNFDIKLLQGIECDILRDGTLDYNNEILNNFDLVVISIHNFTNDDENTYTKRIIRAIENPKSNILGHPTGRLLLARQPYPVNIHKIIDACSANNVAIEINSNPHRLDLDWRLFYYAREKNCKFAINADAHSVQDFEYIQLGISLAKKCGITTDEVINCYDFEKLKSFLIK